MSDLDLRTSLVLEARSWIGTPWHHRGNVKGAGVDCAHFVKAPFVACGVIADFDLGYYPRDWHLHQDNPRFLARLAEYADPLPAGAIGQPADLAMFKFGRHAAHGAIVIEWPLIVHAYLDERMVVISDAARHADLATRFAGFWRVRGME